MQAVLQNKKCVIVHVLLSLIISVFTTSAQVPNPVVKTNKGYVLGAVENV